MSFLTTLYNSTIGRAFGTSVDPITAKLQQTHLESSTDQHINTKTKRKRGDAEHIENQHPTERRRRADADTYTSVYEDVSYPDQKILRSTNRDGYGDTQVFRPDDRMLMPPPILVHGSSNTHHGDESSLLRFNSERRHTGAFAAAADFDTASQMSIKQRSSLEIVPIDEYDMEKARRHAAATTLPANSGIWERAERDLFFHLSLRGFEPILPKTWMMDFPTLPISLYHVDAHQGEPMIQVAAGAGKQFRAIKAFDDLLHIGRDVRDKVLTPPQGANVNTEIIIEKAIKKYFAWAFADAGLQVDSATAKDRGSKRKHKRSKSSKEPLLLPIHVVYKQRPNQTTTDCLFALKHRMHQLAARHREARGIHDSIEYDLPSPGNSSDRSPSKSNHASEKDSDVDIDIDMNSNSSSHLDETTVLEDSEHDLPVIYGLMICRSILAIFTLNSHAAAAAAISPHKHHSSPTNININPHRPTTLTQQTNTPSNKPPNPPQDQTSDPRYISDFDFSHPRRDLWNSLVIAIVVIQVRRDLLAVASSSQSLLRADGAEDEDEEEESSDPDA